MKKTSMKKNIGIIFVVLVLTATAFFIGLYAGSVPEVKEIIRHEPAGIEPEKDDVQVNVSIILATLFLRSDCYVISFDVTEDQAFSIASGIEKVIVARPLTHDIMKDIFENFRIDILMAKIDSYEDGIYKAKLIARQGSNILTIDSRPSDAVAISTRTGTPLYVKKSLLENGTKIC